jgi:excisionase family DNA binding protein
MTADPAPAPGTEEDAELPEITSTCLRARYGPGVTAADETSGGAGYPPILTTAQAAELLQVHVEYLRKMVREERIPAHRFPGGREIRFVRDELITWVQQQPGHDRSPGAEERADA